MSNGRCGWLSKAPHHPRLDRVGTWQPRCQCVGRRVAGRWVWAWARARAKASNPQSHICPLFKANVPTKAPQAMPRLCNVTVSGYTSLTADLFLGSLCLKLAVDLVNSSNIALHLTYSLDVFKTNINSVPKTINSLPRSLSPLSSRVTARRLWTCALDLATPYKIERIPRRGKCHSSHR